MHLLRAEAEQQGLPALAAPVARLIRARLLPAAEADAVAKALSLLEGAVSVLRALGSQQEEADGASGSRTATTASEAPATRRAACIAAYSAAIATARWATLRTQLNSGGSSRGGGEHVGIAPAEGAGAAAAAGTVASKNEREVQASVAALEAARRRAVAAVAALFAQESIEDDDDDGGGDDDDNNDHDGGGIDDFGLF